MEHRAEPARIHELASVLALLRDADLPEDGVAETFRNFVVVRDDETVVAAAGLEVCGDDGLVRSVVVDPAFRGQGLAGLLLAGLLELASHLHLRALYLLTTTARGFFLKHGFSDCSREEAPPGIRESWEFKTGCPASSAFMRREVGRTPRSAS
jgi:amino-acid N-acetyltransferase